jgi:hypothetical protein
MSRCGGQQLGRPQIDHTLENESESNTAGKGMLAIAKALGVGASTVQRVKEPSSSKPGPQHRQSVDNRKAVSRPGIDPHLAPLTTYLQW